MTSPPRLRGYAVERLLGSGATSDVWAARASASGARVALKRIRVAADAGRARDEAALLAALDHPNLVRLHDLIETDEAAVLVLDLAEGGSLAELLATRGRLTPGEVITALAPVAAALAYLHDACVVHGDVSAANVLFAANGVPLLADVGVARLTGDERDAEASPAYVDPVVAAGAVPGPPSDVFMLGGVALHALTGRPPWPAVGPTGVDAGALDRVPSRLAAADVPAAMVAPVTRALAADPKRRGTAADLALDLAHGASAVAVELAAGRVPPGPAAGWTGPRHAALPPGDPPPTRLVARPRPVIPRPPPRRSRRLALLVGGALAALIGCAGVAWASIGTAQQHPPALATSRPAPQVETTAQPSPPRPAAAPTARHPDWLAELDRLDAVRARAFAERRPALLARVYPPGRLRAADVAALARLVPPGCGLAGVRTRYRQLHLVARDGGAVITVGATIAASRLSCPGRATRTAPGAHARLRIVLAQTSAGVRIVGEREIG
jgi:hypothetical protein